MQMRFIAHNYNMQMRFIADNYNMQMRFIADISLPVSGDRGIQQIR